MRLSLATVSSLSDGEIEGLFMRARWGEVPACLSCGCSTLYRLETRNVWKCRDCKKQFSVTSGSCLASRKLPPRTILIAILLFVSGAKGIASLQLQRMLGVQYHTAYIFTQKIREALLAEQETLPQIEGDVEVDGAFFGGHIERFNFRDRRTGKIHSRRRYGERRVVVVARQRGGRTLTTVVANSTVTDFS